MNDYAGGSPPGSSLRRFLPLPIPWGGFFVPVKKIVKKITKPCCLVKIFTLPLYGQSNEAMT